MGNFIGKIRDFENKDAGKCRKIIRACFNTSVDLPREIGNFIRSRYTQRGYLEEKAEHYPFFVYERTGMVLGFGAIEDNEIKKLYVHPNFQKERIGSALLTHLEVQATDIKNYRETVLYAFENSLRFYSKRGYGKIGPFTIERNGILIPTIAMVKHFPKKKETNKN